MFLIFLACTLDAPAPAPLETRPDPTPAPAEAPTPAPVHAREALEAEVAAAGLPWPPPDVRLHVDKSDRRLDVYSGDRRLARYRVGLGGAPTGDKVREGDQRTPTGRFTVVTRNEASRYHLFLGLSYPTTRHAEAGLARGIATEAHVARVADAERRGVRPPWDTPLGGAVGIHGHGGGSDWTLGCVAVDDDEIEALWAIAPHGTVVVIEE